MSRFNGASSVTRTVYWCHTCVRPGTSAGVEVKIGRTVRQIALLNASAWAVPNGTLAARMVVEYGDGSRKPTYDAFRIPVFVPGAVRRRTGTFRVWGALRPAPNGSAQTVDVIFRAGSRGGFRLVRRVRTTSLRNYVDTRVRLSRSGLLRLRWRNPAGGDVELSRTVAIAIRRR